MEIFLEVIIAFAILSGIINSFTMEGKAFFFEVLGTICFILVEMKLIGVI